MTGMRSRKVVRDIIRGVLREDYFPKYKQSKCIKQLKKTVVSDSLRKRG